MLDPDPFCPREGGYFTPKGKLIIDALADDLQADIALRAGHRTAGDKATGVLYVWDPERAVWAPALGLLQSRLVVALGSRWSTHYVRETLSYLLNGAAPLLPPDPGWVAFHNLVVSDVNPSVVTPRVEAELAEDEEAWNYRYTGDWTAYIPHHFIPEGLWSESETGVSYGEALVRGTRNTSVFLSQVLPADAQEFAWEMLGYFLTQRRVDRKAIMLRGEGANGKSRLLALIENLLGPENVSHLPLQSINKASSPELGALRDKLANIVDDMGTAVGRDISNFKTAVTGGKIMVNPKYQHPYEFEPRAKFAFAVNRLPHSPDTSAAWGTRWVIVPFDATFAPEDRLDPEVLDNLLIREAPYIVTRAMHALSRLIARGHFDIPPSFDAAKLEFEEASNPVLAWLHDGGATFDSAATVKGKELLLDFQNSPHGRGYQGIKAREFYEHLRGVPGVSTYEGGGHLVRIKGLRRTEPLALPARSTTGDVESA